jgi:hypothetical protein
VGCVCGSGRYTHGACVAWAGNYAGRLTGGSFTYWSTRRALVAALPGTARAPSASTPKIDHGAGAYSEARQRQRDVILPDGTTHAGRTPAHWQRVALIVAHDGKRVCLDTATRMLERDNQ